MRSPRLSSIALVHETEPEPFSAAISHIASTDPRATVVPASSGVSTGTSSPNKSVVQRLSTFYRHLRSTIKSILASPESRRIYFFLCLNLAYMFVQMAYGIWTNSLGLISDCAPLPSLVPPSRRP